MDRQSQEVGRVLAEMQAAILLQASRGARGEARVDLSRIGQRSVAGLMAAVRCERRNRPNRIVPVRAEDALTFVLTPLPLVRLDEATTGSCLLTAELDPAPGRPRTATLSVELRRGRVVSDSNAPPRRGPSAHLRGDVDGWLAALLDGDVERLRLGGYRELAIELVGRMHAELPSARPTFRKLPHSGIPGDPRPTLLGELLPPTSRPGRSSLYSPRASIVPSRRLPRKD